MVRGPYYTGQIVMSMLVFTAVGVLLYLVSDYLLQQAEIAAGRRFEHRTLIFFVLLLTLALITFSLIQRYTGNS